jgi:peptidoglycan/LPS O-acetylase OafA/YrhL
MGTFRFLLAMSVVVSHFGGLWGHKFFEGSMAVRCFFMVSGFLMALILSGKYDAASKRGLWLFYSNRALRIFIPYWSFIIIITVACCAIFPAGRQNLIKTWEDQSFPMLIYLLITNVFVVGQEWAMWMPYDIGTIVHFHIIPQAWSISLELMFYAIAPVVVRCRSYVLAIYMIAAFLLRQYLNAKGMTHAGYNFRFFPVELIFFFSGVLCYRAYRFAEGSGLMTGTLSLVVSTLFLAILISTPFWRAWESQLFYIVVAIALPFLFHFSRQARFDNLLGELSYPIYLSHLAVITVAGPWITAGRWNEVILIALTVGISGIYVQLLDAPFEKYRQRRSAEV